MRKLKSKLSFLLAINMAFSPTVAFSQDSQRLEPVLSELRYAPLVINNDIDNSKLMENMQATARILSDERNPEAVLHEFDSKSSATPSVAEIDKGHKNSTQYLKAKLDELDKLREPMTLNICSDLQKFARYEYLIRSRTGTQGSLDKSSLSNLLTNTKQGMMNVNMKNDIQSSYQKKIFFFDNDQEMIKLMSNLIGTKNTMSFPAAENNFFEACKKNVYKKLATMKMTQFLKALSPEGEDKNFGPEKENVFSQQLIDSGCNVTIIKSGVHALYQTSCDEGISALVGNVNSSLINFMAKNSITNYQVIGDENYCNNCMSGKYDTFKPKNAPDFETHKNKVKKDLANTFAKESSKAALMKFTTHMENVLKMNNQRPSIRKSENRFNDFYCKDSFEKALKSNCDKGGRSAAEKRKLFNDAIKQMGLCQNDANCESMQPMGVLASLESKIEKIDNGNRCQSLNFAQAGSVHQNLVELKSSQIIFNGLKGFDNELMKGLLLYEMQETDDPVKAFSKVITKLVVADEGNSYSSALDSVLHQDSSFKNHKKSFEEEHNLKTIRNNWLNRYTSGNFRKRGSISADFQKSIEKNGEMSALRSYLMKGEKGEKLTASQTQEKVEKILKSSMNAVPEMAVTFGSAKNLFENIDLGKENGDSFFSTMLGGTDPSKEYSSAKNLLANDTQESCSALKKELEEALCIDEKSPLTNFSPTDVADAANYLEKNTPNFANHDKIALSSLSCNLNSSPELSDTKKIGDPANYIEKPSNFALSMSKNPLATDSDARNIPDQACDLLPEKLVGHSKNILKSMRGQLLTEEEKKSDSDFNNEVQQIEQATTTGYSGVAANVFNEAAANHQAAIANSSNGDILYGGYNPNNSRPTGSNGSVAKNVMNNVNSSLDALGTTGSAGNVSYTGGSNSSTPQAYSSVSDSFESGNTETIVNANLFGANNQVVQSPTYYPNYYPTANVAASEDPNDPTRRKAIQSLNKDFSGDLTAESLNSLSTDELKRLLELADSSKGKSSIELENQKKILEEERKNLDLQKQIFALQQEKEKLLNENEKQVQATTKKVSAETLSNSSDSVPTIAAAKNNRVSLESAAAMANRAPASISRDANVDFSATGANDNRGATGGGFNSGTVASGGSGNAALRSYTSTLTSISDEGRAKVSYGEVDKYLRYIKDNKVAGTELIKRNSNGEVLELLIPNKEGKLIPIDVSELSESEIEKLEQEVASLFEEQEKSGVIVAAGVNVKTGGGIRSLESIEEKIAKLENEVKQESHLIDLKMKILDSISKR